VQFGEGADASAPEVEQQLALASSPFKARSDRSKGLPVAIERQTVAQFLDHWLKSIKANVTPHTNSIRNTFGSTSTLCWVDSSCPSMAHNKCKAFLTGKSGAIFQPGPCSSHTLFSSMRSDDAVKWNLAARNVAKLVTRHE